MAMVESALGEAVGELYVTRFFGGDAKAKALSVVESVRQALEQRLNEVIRIPTATALFYPLTDSALAHPFPIFTGLPHLP